MANPEHVEIVKRGNEAIAAWRAKTWSIPLDLSEADLSATFQVKSDLRRANLRGAILSRADLSGADLSGANLSMIHLRGANLNDARIDDASMGYTVLTTVDLSKVKGLESVIHDRPSSIGIDTLYKSHGKIPEEFLRGCGVPEDFIKYLPSLIGAMQPIQYQSCFISYSSRDEEFARRLHERMRSEKLRVWFAPEEMQGGKKLIEQIDRAIQVNDRLLLVLSEHSMNSEWVKTEIRKARQAELREQRQKLFPIRLVSFDRIRDGAASTPTPAKTWASKSANTTSPTSRTGKTTTPSRPPSPTCSAPCAPRPDRVVRRSAGSGDPRTARQSFHRLHSFHR